VARMVATNLGRQACARRAIARKRIINAIAKEN
jgi:hypothetical protein